MHRTLEAFEGLPVNVGLQASARTDVAGRLDTFGVGHTLLTGVYRSLLPTAIARGITDEDRAAALLTEAERDAARFPDRAMLWPLLIGAWKQKPGAAASGWTP